MCGIAGIVEYGRAAGGVTDKLLLAMRETLVHRGPDDAGMWISRDRRVGLAHRRLSIVDLAHGGQPMFGEAGECLIFNGEIYNYPELRQQLERQGTTFRTTCDTEVILKLYQRDGLDCLESLNGMFAFALWDPRLERLLFARDRVGEKPFYWADVDGRFIFASEIKALLEHPAVTPTVNEGVLPGYLTNLVTSSPETLYGGIQKVPAGCMGICNVSGVQISRYWNPFTRRHWAECSLHEAVGEVRSLLDRSTNARLMSDVPVGVLLSGGLDSSTLVGLLADRAHEFATFSVGFTDHADLDERAEARRVASHFGNPHHEVAIGEKEALEFLPELIYHQDEPLADPVCLPLHFVCQLARRKGVKVVLAGEGADELFWGYPSYQSAMHRWRWMRSVLALPKPVRSVLPRLVSSRRHPYFHDTLDGLARGAPLPMHMPLGLSGPQRQLVLADPAPAEWAPGWSRPNGSGSDPLTNLAFDTQDYEFRLRLPELLLMRIDRFSMANGVEARVPFLDPNLVDFVYTLPLDLKLQNGISKVVMREAVRDIVPRWVLERPKQGFGAPVSQWFESRMGTLFERLAVSEGIRRYFRPEVLLSSLAGGRRSPTLPLWPIMNFALWHWYWIEGKSLEPLLSSLEDA
jgi:asparagine synthase (glutamine-hydrolysing)